jgi:glucose/arabinose dehydrogenase
MIHARGLTLIGLVAASWLAQSLLAGEPTRCPPTSTQTIPSPGDPSLVLAEGPTVTAVRIAGPFEVPWALGLLPDGSFLVTERPGRLKHVRAGADPHAVSGVPKVLYAKHGGLLDVAIDPQFATNGLIFLTYLQGEEAASTMRILRARYDEVREALTEETIIFESTTLSNPELIGGRIALTGNGDLFLSVGDMWKGAPAQDLGDDAGSIIRIRTDGSVPDDNPFAHYPGARPEIWSYGNRNPQGLAFDKVTGLLWEHEHGPQGGDEVNLILPGKNYGWPLATYGIDYSGHMIANGTYPGTEQPVHYWVPLSIAPSSLAVETVGARTTLFIGTLAGETLVELTLADNCVVSETHLLKHELGRIRDVRIDESGVLFVLAEDGMLYRIERALDTAGQGKKPL